MRAPAASRKWGGATIVLKVPLKLKNKSLRAWFDTTLLNLTLRGCVINPDPKKETVKNELSLS